MSSTVVGTPAGGMTALEESELRKLRRENKQLVEELSHVSRTPRDEVFERHRVSKVKSLVVRLQLDFNNARHQLECRRRQLASLKSKLNETTMLTEDRGEAAGIVEEGKPSVNELHASAMTRVQEVEELLTTSEYTNKVYEHILKRYDKERQGMENAYLQMNSSLSRLSKAHDEMEISIKVTKHEEQSLYNEMSAMIMEMDEMRVKRERMLGITRKRVDEQAELHKYMSDRDVNRAGIAKEAQGDLDERGERVLQGRMMAVHTKKVHSKNARESAKQVEVKMRRAAGGGPDSGPATDGHELMNRLESIQDAKSEMEEKRVAAERRREQREEELATAQQQLTEVQTSGVDLSYRRAVYDDIERRMTAAEVRCGTYKHKYEALLSNLLPLYNGLEMLSGKVDGGAIKGRGRTAAAGKGGGDAGGDDGADKAGADKGGIMGGGIGKEMAAAGESLGQDRDSSEKYGKYFEHLENLETQLTAMLDGIDNVGPGLASEGPASARQGQAQLSPGDIGEYD